MIAASGPTEYAAPVRPLMPDCVMKPVIETYQAPHTKNSRNIITERRVRMSMGSSLPYVSLSRLTCFPICQAGKPDLLVIAVAVRMGLVPPPGRFDDFAHVFVFGFPAELALGGRRVGDQLGRIAFAAGDVPRRNRVARHLAARRRPLPARSRRGRCRG